MPVPDYQSFMLPLLKIAGDGKDHSSSEADAALAVMLNLSDEDRGELLPSGTQSKFYNRVRWASTYLKKAGLLQGTGHGHFRVTERGLEVLKSNPTELTRKYLLQFPEFVAFQSKSPKEALPKGGDQEEQVQTPEEVLESAYQMVRLGLAQELLDRIKLCTPKFFERLVVELLVAMGYGGSRKDAGQAVGQSGDGGIDGIIKEDKLVLRQP